jgi:uncharacterized protein YfkK (UPF0435 family)
MLFRVKYLFGIMIGSFGLIYLLFAALGMKINNAPSDKPFAYAMFGLHSIVAITLFTSSYRDRKKEDSRLDEIFTALNEINGGRVPHDEFASIAHISLEDAYNYLKKKSPNALGRYFINEDGKLVRPFDFENRDF